VTAAPAPGGRRLASPVTALVLGAVVLVLMAAEPPLASLGRQSLMSSGGSVPLPYSVIFAAVGFVVAWRKPGNPLGWLILGAAGFFALSEDASFYAIADYRLRHGSLPLGWLALITQPGWAPGITAVGLIVLLFPDGRPPSPRWWWALWPYIALALLWIAGALAFTATAILAHQTRVDAGGNLLVLEHPTGGAAWWGAAQNLFFLVLVVSWLASLAGQAMSYRRASGDRRHQLKWLLTGAACCLAGLLLSLVDGSEGGWRVVIQIFGAAGVIALPVCIGIGILRYRLFDIDRILGRTVAYAIITGLLLGVYAGLVLLATQVLGFASTWAVAASTLAAAALFTPLRRRVQRAVDRRFNRARYDADRMVDAFAARLQDAVDLDTVRADLAAVVRAALEPAEVAVWIRGGAR
jgi:hypothetical protein